MSEQFSVAQFVELANEDLLYLAEQLRIMLDLKHEQRVILFHKAFLEDQQYIEQLENNNIPIIENDGMGKDRGICRGMLRCLLKICWKNHGKSLLVDSNIIANDDVCKVLNCDDTDLSHKHFANMCLALWTLSISQYLVERRAQLTDNNIANNNNNDSVDNNDKNAAHDTTTSSQQHAPAANNTSVEQLLDDFLLHVDHLRRRSGTASLQDDAKNFVFNMALLYFLYQIAIRDNLVRLKAVVLKAFFPLWFVADAAEWPAAEQQQHFEFQQLYAPHSLKYFLTAQQDYANTVLSECQQSVEPSSTTDNIEE